MANEAMNEMLRRAGSQGRITVTEDEPSAGGRWLRDAIDGAQQRRTGEGQQDEVPPAPPRVSHGSADGGAGTQRTPRTPTMNDLIRGVADPSSERDRGR